MKNPRICRAAVTAFAAAALGLAGLASDKVSDEAKAYQAELAILKGQAPMPIIEKIEAWKFELSDAWKADDPAAKDIGQHRMGKVKFSKQEIKDIFGEPGKYKIAIYSKLVGTSSATRGTISDIGMSNNKDATVELKIFTVVRIVFKDERLVDVRTWPKVEGSTTSGGNSWSVW